MKANSKHLYSVVLLASYKVNSKSQTCVFIVWIKFQGVGGHCGPRLSNLFWGHFVSISVVGWDFIRRGLGRMIYILVKHRVASSSLPEDHDNTGCSDMTLASLKFPIEYIRSCTPGINWDPPFPYRIICWIIEMLQIEPCPSAWCKTRSLPRIRRL